MRILFLAPQPFFQERGTPIAVRLALEVLCERSGLEIDLLTYHEGCDVEISGVRNHRIRSISCLCGVGPGVSLKKLACDALFTFKALAMVWKSRRTPYSLIHAVEEGVFIALLCKLFFGIPYIYDMDSSLALQLTEKWGALRPLAPIFSMLERLAVKHSVAVVPVCDALAAIADKHGSRHTFVLNDVSLLRDAPAGSPAWDLRKEGGLKPDELSILYIGNLEAYQGVRLLIDGFARMAATHANSKVVIIGGTEAHIAAHRALAEERGVADRVVFLGPRPVASLSTYLKQADILASPRVRGNNTPMKIYSYLHSGTPIIATALPTHTQVMGADVAELVTPEPEAFAAGLARLCADKSHRERVGRAGFELAERRYTFSIFSERLTSLYDRVQERLEGRAAPAEPALQPLE